MPNNIYIGTSGWHYKHWKGPFYPDDLSEKDFLSFYSNYFDTVEINNSFYRLPEKRTCKQWHKAVKDDFIFSVKASRYITHIKKLNYPEHSLPLFLSTIYTLRKKLGPVLFQLPPSWRLNIKRLEDFLAQLPPKKRYTFEFRNETWFDDSVYNLLSKYNVAFCLWDLKGKMSPEIVTADFVYIRLHGPTENAYEGSYSKMHLNKWARKFRKWVSQGKDIYCYFDNDQSGFAAKNALALKQIINSSKKLQRL